MPISGVCFDISCPDFAPIVAWHCSSVKVVCKGRLRVDAVEKVGATLTTRNNRIAQAGFLNRSCAFDARLESILLEDPLKIFFRQHRSRREQLEVSKSFPLFPCKRKSAAISNTPAEAISGPNFSSPDVPRSLPGRASQRVQRKFEIPSAVRLGIRQATAGDIHLQRMQHELWYRQR